MKISQETVFRAAIEIGPAANATPFPKST